ncbi:MAG: endonuclease/exonuclease/phosphatase family protein [Clostridia bacterium]|nr:endonuclease/exonuclease/phosphatase family protein [Clostridia bacterium]
MKKWTKYIALLGILAISLSMLSGCVSGRNYSKEMMGNKGGLPTFHKDQVVEVPYTGDKVSVIETDDPVLAGLCDADGNLLDGSGKVDLSNLGGSVSNSGSSDDNDNDNDAAVPGDDDQNDADTPAPDKDSDKKPIKDLIDPNDSEDPLAVYEADESGTKVRIMSQNVRKDDSGDATAGLGGAVRMYRLQKLVEKNDPDIIGTQEANAFWIDAFSQLFGSEYSMSYQYRGASSGSDEACAILWKTEKYNLLDKGQFWLSESPNQVSTMNGQYYPRIAHWVELEDKATGEKILFFSTHFDFPRSASHQDGYTLPQIIYLRSLFIKVCAEHPDAYPFIVGDFNIHFDTDSYRAICDGKEFFDMRDVANDMSVAGHCRMGDIRNGTSGAFEKDDGSAIIDYIFSLPNKRMAVDYYTFLYDRIAVEEKGIMEGPVSDHFAVLADFRIGTSVSYAEYYNGNAK